MMKSTGRTIAKNASVMMASQVVTWGLSLLLTVFLPRYLGAAAVGKIYLANSLWAIVAMVATLGMDMMITKAVARRPEKTPELFGTTLYVRTGLFAFGTIGIWLYARAAGYPGDTQVIIYIVGVANFITLFTTAIESIIKGMERMEFISLANIIGRVVQVGLTLLMIALRQDIYWIAAVGTLAALAHMVFVLYYLGRLTRFDMGFHPAKAVLMIKESFSYMVLRLALVIYQQVDIVIISLLVNEKNIGWYGVAGQLFGTFVFVPTVFTTVLYPVLSRMFTSSPDSLVKIMRKSFDMMWLIAIPIGLGVMLIADPLILLLYGPDFWGAGPVLAVIGLVIIVTYQNMLLGQFLISTDRQMAWSWVIGIGTIITVPLDLLLVPICQNLFGIGALGGSLSFLVTETAMTIAGVILLPKGTFDRQNVSRALRVVAAGLLMVGLTWWMRYFFILIPIAAAALVYCAAILLMRVIQPEDWALLRSLMDGFIAKLRHRAAQPVNVSGK